MPVHLDVGALIEDRTEYHFVESVRSNNGGFKDRFIFSFFVVHIHFSFSWFLIISLHCVYARFEILSGIRKLKRMDLYAITPKTINRIFESRMIGKNKGCL